MYLFLSLICCVGFILAWSMGAARGIEWAMLVPFVAANGFAAWVGMRGGKAYPGVFIAVCVDLAAGMIALFAIGLFLSPMSGMWTLAPIAVAAMGGVAAVIVERSAGVSHPLLPVRGEWGRRFLAGVAVLLLQPASPGILIASYLMLANMGSSASPWIVLWLISTLFYLAPVYRRIVSGVPANVDLSSSHAQATTLSEFLAADAANNPNVSRSFARFVVRCEYAIYLRLLETGLEPNDAGRRCRGLLRELWRDPWRTSYDHLQVDELAPQIEDRGGPRAPAGCERLLLDLALRHAAPSAQKVTAEWVKSGKDFNSLKAAEGVPRAVVSRRVRIGTGEALFQIAVALSAKHPQGNPRKAANQ